MHPVEKNMDYPGLAWDICCINLCRVTEINSFVVVPRYDDLLLFGMCPKQNPMLQRRINWLVLQWVKCRSQKGHGIHMMAPAQLPRTTVGI